MADYDINRFGIDDFTGMNVTFGVNDDWNPRRSGTYLKDGLGPALAQYETKIREHLPFTAPLLNELSAMLAYFAGEDGKAITALNTANSGQFLQNLYGKAPVNISHEDQEEQGVV